MAKKETHELIVRTKKDIENDKTSLEISIPDGFAELLRMFAVKNKFAEIYGKKRHLIKNILVNCGEWKQVYEIFFLKDLLKDQFVTIEVDNLGVIEDITNKLINIRSLIEVMLKAQTNEEIKFVVDVTKKKVKEITEEIK